MFVIKNISKSNWASICKIRKHFNLDISNVNDVSLNKCVIKLNKNTSNIKSRWNWVRHVQLKQPKEILNTTDMEFLARLF